MDEKKNEHSKQGSMAAVIAVIVLLLAAVGLIWFIMNEEVNEVDETDPAEETAQIQEPTIAELLATSSEFSTLEEAVSVAGLSEMFSDENAELTVLAPTDSAFEALPEGTLDSLLEDPDELEQVLLYHTLSGEVSSDAIRELDGSTIETEQGQELAISVTTDDLIMINNEATVITTDVSVSNGIVHIIDVVLIP